MEYASRCQSVPEPTAEGPSKLASAALQLLKLVIQMFDESGHGIAAAHAEAARCHLHAGIGGRTRLIWDSSKGQQS